MQAQTQRYRQKKNARLRGKVRHKGFKGIGLGKLRLIGICGLRNKFKLALIRIPECIAPGFLYQSLIRG